MNNQPLSREDVISLLHERMKGITMKQLGEVLDKKRPISLGYLNDVLKGRKRPGPRILKALGLRLEKQAEVYTRVRPLAKA